MVVFCGFVCHDSIRYKTKEQKNVGYPPQITAAIDEKDTDGVVLPEKVKSQKAPSFVAPIDHTIRIPERLAGSCWKRLLLCSFFCAVGLADAQVPHFRAHVHAGLSHVAYRLSLSHLVAYTRAGYGAAVDFGVNRILPEVEKGSQK